MASVNQATPKDIYDSQVFFSKFDLSKDIIQEATGTYYPDDLENTKVETKVHTIGDCIQRSIRSFWYEAVPFRIEISENDSYSSKVSYTTNKEVWNQVKEYIKSLITEDYTRSYLDEDTPIPFFDAISSYELTKKV